MRRLLALILLLAAALLSWQSWQPQAHQPLVVYCAAGLKAPVEQASAAFTKETSIPVQLQFGGSGTLLSQLKIAPKADLLISADDDSLRLAREAKLIAETLPLAQQQLVLACAASNPQRIQSLDDLLARKLKLGIPNPEAASAGKVAKKLLDADWPRISNAAAVTKPTVTEVAADVQIGACDAALIWDSTATQFKLGGIAVKALEKHRERAHVSVTQACKQPTAALQLARFLTAAQRGGEHFKKAGFKTIAGDLWEAQPKLVLYSGAVNRKAIEPLLKDFAQREGVDLTTVFNGCGILCASMKTMKDAQAPRFPDVYYACDICFVEPVAEAFPEAVLLTEAEIVIATPRGNKANIHSLADLARPGLRIGLCNAEQSTLGYMTAAMLRSMNLFDSVMRNASSQVPTGDLLVNQMLTGSLDACVVYRTNLHGKPEAFDTIALPADKAKAIQPFAVHKNSPRRQLGLRLLEHLRANRQAFEKVGFTWRGDSKPIPSEQLPVPDYLRPKS